MYSYIMYVWLYYVCIVILYRLVLFKSTKGKKKSAVKVSLAGGKATKKSTMADHDFNDMGTEFDDFM